MNFFNLILAKKNFIRNKVMLRWFRGKLLIFNSIPRFKK